MVLRLGNTSFHGLSFAPREPLLAADIEGQNRGRMCRIRKGDWRWSSSFLHTIERTLGPVRAGRTWGPPEKKYLRARFFLKVVGDGCRFRVIKRAVHLWFVASLTGYLDCEVFLRYADKERVRIIQGLKSLLRCASSILCSVCAK